MSHARETTLTFFVMHLSPLMSEIYLLVNLFEKPIHNAIRRFLVHPSVSSFSHVLTSTLVSILNEVYKL